MLEGLLKACFQATSFAHFERGDSLAGAELVARSIESCKQIYCRQTVWLSEWKQVEDLQKLSEWAYASRSKVACTSSANLAWQIHTHKICELSVSESCTKRLHMQSLTVFGGVNSQYTSVRHLGNSWLSEALISEKWHDWKYEIFTTYICVCVCDDIITPLQKYIITTS